MIWIVEGAKFLMMLGLFAVMILAAVGMGA